MGSIARKMDLADRALLCDLETMAAHVAATVGTVVVVAGTVAYPGTTAPGSAAAVGRMDCKTGHSPVVAEIVVAVVVAVVVAADIVLAGLATKMDCRSLSAGSPAAAVHRN